MPQSDVGKMMCGCINGQSFDLRDTSSWYEVFLPGRCDDCKGMYVLRHENLTLERNPQIRYTDHKDIYFPESVKSACENKIHHEWGSYKFYPLPYFSRDEFQVSEMLAILGNVRQVALVLLKGNDSNSNSNSNSNSRFGLVSTGMNNVAWRLVEAQMKLGYLPSLELIESMKPLLTQEYSDHSLRKWLLTGCKRTFREARKALQYEEETFFEQFIKQAAERISFDYNGSDSVEITLSQTPGFLELFNSSGIAVQFDFRVRQPDLKTAENYIVLLDLTCGETTNLPPGKYELVVNL